MINAGRKVGRQYSSLHSKARRLSPKARKAQQLAQQQRADAYAAACQRWADDNA